MKNRLQFIHQNTVFANRDAAKEYLRELITNERPSLYAEPIVVKYASDDSEKGPNILLAIGSVGDGTYDGEYRPTDQRVFFIDITLIDETLEAIWERIAEVVRQLTLIPLTSDTTEIYTSVAPSGTSISADVRTAGAQTYSGVARPNQILTITDDGLYHFVDARYSNGLFTFQVNNEEKYFSIPTVTGGVYHYDDADAEKLELFLSNGESIKIDLSKLVDEWTVLPPSATDTPIVLKRETIQEEHKWQDILTGDIRLHEGDGNILYKHDSGRTVYATVNLEYVELENKLVFTWSENGSVHSKDIALNSVKVIDYIRYDSETEEIVIGYKTASTGQTVEVRIPVGDIITEWTPVSEGHNVILNRARSVSGTDELSADVRIASTGVVANNILETVGANHDVFVRGEADNIKYGNTNVDAELTKHNSEIAFLSGTCDTLTDKIGSGFTADPHENVTAKYNEMVAREDAIQAELDEEESTRESADTQLSTRITNEVNRASAAEDALSNRLTAEVNRADAAEQFLSGKTDDLFDTVGSGFTTDPHDNITAKYNEMVAREDAIQAELDEEESTRESADTQLSTRITNEVNRASDAEDALSTRITNEVNRADTAEQFLSGKTDDLFDTVGSGFTTDPHTNITAKYNEMVAREDAIQAELDDEESTRESADTQLSTRITNEVNRATSAEDALSNRITAETNRADAAEQYLSGQTDDIFATIGTGFTTDPHDNITAKYDSMVSRQNSLQSELNDEASARTASDDQLSTRITNEVNRASGAEDALSNRITAETNRADAAEQYLSGQTDDINDRIGDGFSVRYTIADAIAAVSASSSGDVTAETQRATAAENALGERITNETNRATIAEHSLSGAIDSVSGAVDFVSGSVDYVSGVVAANRSDFDSAVTRFDNRDNALEDYIDSVSALTVTKLSAITAGNTGIEINNTNPTNPKVLAHLNGSSGNIVTLNEGIYANVDLTYNSVNNILTFTTTNGSKDIPLVSNSLVNKVYYRPSDESIVIEYTVNGVRMPDVVVPVHDLIQEWTVDNHGQTVTLTKTVNASGVSADTLSASVNISNAQDNILEIVDNEYLKVSNAPIVAVENRVTALENHSGATDALIDTVIDGVGLNDDGTYSPIPNTHYVSDATSVQDAIDKLDAAVHGAANDVVISGNVLYSFPTPEGGQAIGLDAGDSNTTYTYDDGDYDVNPLTNENIVKFIIINKIRGGKPIKVLYAETQNVICGDYD